MSENKLKLYPSSSELYSYIDDDEEDTLFDKIVKKVQKSRGHLKYFNKSRSDLSSCSRFSYSTYKSESRKNNFVVPKNKVKKMEPVPDRSIDSWVLFISGLHEETTEEDIYNKFSDRSYVKSVKSNKNPYTDYMKGYALVQFQTYEDALQARSLDGTDLLGNKIRVNWCYVKGANNS